MSRPTTHRQTDRRTASLTDRLCARVQSRLAAAEAEADAGMTTAEYAMGTVAVAGCGGVLYKIITSDQVLQVIKAVIIHAFRLF